MLRFFEPDADSWWPAAAPPQPPRHYLAAGDSRRQGGAQYHQRRAAPALPAPLAGRRVPSALATVDLVKGRWFPSPAPASNVSRSSSPNSSSSVDSMNSYGGSGMNNCRPSSGGNITRDSASERSFSPFQAWERGSAMTVDTATKTQDQKTIDWTNKRRMIDERHKMNNMEVSVSVRQSKNQKTHVEEENLRSYLPPFESTSSPTRMIATNQNLKVVPISKSKKMGDKITALQQLVSPFGKTDTASVLHEATVYIKALQEQIKLLSNPHLESTSSLKSMQAKDGGETHRRLPKKTIGLREAGLCLVPISPAITSFVDQLQLDGCVSESLPW